MHSRRLLTRPPRGKEPIQRENEKIDLPDRGLDGTQLAKIALAATVSLVMQDENGTALGTGSGFFVQRNLIATNYHVIEGAAKGSATLVNTKNMYRVSKVSRQPMKHTISPS